MISVAAVTDRYILQPSLIGMHRASLEWLSATLLWKLELAFFQRLLDQEAPKFGSVDEKKKVGHFQNIITYYSGELVDQLRKNLREHESSLAHILKERDESDNRYFKEHQGLMSELQSFSESFQAYKHDFFYFLEAKIKVTRR